MATISRPPRPATASITSSNRGRQLPQTMISPPTSLQMPPGIPSDTFTNDVLSSSPPTPPVLSSLPITRRKRSNSLQSRKKKHLSASFSHININNNTTATASTSSNVSVSSSNRSGIRSLSPFRKRHSKTKTNIIESTNNDIVEGVVSNDSNDTTTNDINQSLMSSGNRHSRTSSSTSGWESAPIDADEMIGMVIPPPSSQVTTNIDSATTNTNTINTRNALVQTSSRESESTSTTPASDYAGGESTESQQQQQRRQSSRGQRRSNSKSKIFSRSSSPFMERVFGDKVDVEQRVFPRSSNLPTSLPPIHNRTPCPMNVFHNPATNFWIATVNVGTSSNSSTSSKHLRAFSYPNELEATQGSLAYAPPRMLPFKSNPHCYLCHGKFAMFRRAKHCRNCGICICSSCSIAWPSRMIPDTFNIKHEKSVTICKSCNWLCNAFQDALLNGDEDQARALYLTGNINLRSPFANNTNKHQKHEEIMFPIHCAAQGGNLSLVTWLIEEKCCPIRLARTSNNKKQIENPIRTSYGRSVLQIAMTSCHVHLIQYFIVKQQISISEMRDLKIVLSAFDAVIRALPDTITVDTTTATTSPTSTFATAIASAPFQGTGENTMQEQQDNRFFDTTATTKAATSSSQIIPPPREYIDIDRIKKNKKRLINGLKHTVSPTKNALPSSATTAVASNNPYYNNNQLNAYDQQNDDDDDSDDMTVTSVADACILCYEKSIDCVITPCGHQICCMECSTCLENTCPVCQQHGTFIKIYKP